MGGGGLVSYHSGKFATWRLYVELVRGEGRGGGGGGRLWSRKMRGGY